MLQIRLTDLFSHIPELSHYVFVMAFFCIILGLLWGRFKAMHVFGVVVLALVITGFMGIKHLYASASNPSILTVMALISLTSVLKKELNPGRLLSKVGNTPRGFLLFTTAFTAGLSAFVNNTPVVALLIPSVKAKAENRGWNPALFLMPLSFAAVAGGTMTLIGTSTNLVLNGMMLENGITGFSFWDFLLPGLAVTTAVLLTTLLLAPLVLKKRLNSTDKSISPLRSYTTELSVLAEGNMTGLTVREAGLRNLNDLYLAEVYRDGLFISPVSPQEVLQANDTLFFTGALEHINRLLDLFPKGLTTLESKFQVDARNDILEVIVPNNSDLIGKAVKQTDFRSRYDAVIVGVQREGQSLRGKIGSLRLQAGDLLLLSVGSTFSLKNDSEISLITLNQYARETKKKLGREKYFLSSIPIIIALGFFMQWTLLLTIGLVLLSGLLCGVSHAEKLKSDFNLELYALLILSVAFGSAVVEGGHAQYFLEQLLLPESPTLGMVLLFAITLVLTNFMTNVSAVAIAFPIAVAMMGHYQLDSVTVFLTLAFAASASFLTPASYQTHLMVMGPGGYTNRDFLKLGLPVLLVYSAVALWILL
jgi:di/tricarboxylate transporter